MKKLFSKDKQLFYLVGGLGIVIFEMTVKPPDVFMYFLTPLALICLGIGLFLNLSGSSH